MLTFPTVRHYTRLGRDIRAARHAKGWSQQKLAELLGCKRQRVILWEGGKHHPNLAYRALLTGLLEAEFDWSPDLEPMDERETGADIASERRVHERAA